MRMVKTVSNSLFFSWVEEEIAKGNEVRFKLKGVSMSPLIRNEKDDVILAPCKTEELKPMDVVLFRYKGRHLLHRIIRRDGDRLWIQGDGSFVAIEQCTVHDVVGKVAWICRPSGKLISVNSRQWRLSSRMWRCSDSIRRLLLRIYMAVC